MKLAVPAPPVKVTAGNRLPGEVFLVFRFTRDFAAHRRPS
jgi:hypothetical protein